MTALYLVLVLSGPCICPTWSTLTYTVNTNMANSAASTCQQGAEVSFTLGKAAAEKALEDGARVWKIGTLPLRIVELKREATTTYTIKEAGEPLKP